MSQDPRDPTPDSLAPGDQPKWSRATAFLVLSWAFLLGLLVVEILGLSIRFDAGSLVERGGWIGWFVLQAHHLPPVLAAMGAALVLLGGKRLGDVVKGYLAQPEAARGSWLGLVLHGLSFAAFTAVTAWLLETELSQAGWTPFLAGSWAFLGLMTLLGWAWAFLQLREWSRLATRLFLPLLGALVVGAMAWGAGFLTDGLWDPLRQSTFWLVERLLRLATSEVISRPDLSVIGTPAFEVEVSPECSGYEGMGLIWVFLAAYLFVFRKSLRFPQALLLVPLGTLAIYLANAIRIAALVLVGTYYSAEAAAGGFHSQAGWLAFNAIALGMVLVSRRMSFFTTALDKGLAEEDKAPPTSAFVAPLLALVAMTMISTALSAGFDWLYPLRVLVVAPVLWWYRRDLLVLGWSWSWTALGIGVGVFVTWMALEPGFVAGILSGSFHPGPDPLGEGLRRLPIPLAIGWLVFRVIGSVVTVPIAEELGFRGYLIRRLQGPDFHLIPSTSFTWLSFVLSSVLFGALHGRWLAGTLAGMAYAGAVYRRGRVADAVLAHAVTNAMIAGYVLATGHWALWG